MADMLAELLAQNDANILRNAICCIRTMGSIGQCQEEMISDEVSILIVVYVCISIVYDYCMYII